MGICERVWGMFRLPCLRFSAGCRFVTCTASLVGFLGHILVDMVGLIDFIVVCAL